MNGSIAIYNINKKETIERVYSIPPPMYIMVVHDTKIHIYKTTQPSSYLAMRSSFEAGRNQL